MRPFALIATASLALTACPQTETPPPPTKAAPVAPPPRAGQVTLLITGHETGHLPSKAPRLLAQWRKEEGWPDALAFSTGDSFSGAVLSSHFFGEPSAEFMKAMQYKASVLGNHDLDLGFDTLKSFRETSGVTMLAANLKDKPDSEQPLKLAPSLVLTRGQVKVGVLGFTSAKTISTTVSGRASGLELIPLEDSVGPAWDSLKKDAPDVVVAIIDDCFSGLKRILTAHPEWKIDLVVGTHCSEAQEDVSGPTKYFDAGDAVSDYISAGFTLRPDGSKSLTAQRKAVAVTGEEDADLTALRARWQTKLDEALGQSIGFSKAGYKQDSNALRLLVATALRDETKADAAIINKKGVRAGLPKGTITQASIYELIPFENAVMTVRIKGEALLQLKANPEAFALLPAKIVPTQEYVLASTEYLYFGGDGLGLEAVTTNPELTGQVWQTPVIAWLRKQGTSDAKPLERMVK
jgi:5'-nucleotidase/UDP-sugar diphosphatase